MARLKRNFFGRGSEVVAKELLGRYWFFESPEGLLIARLRKIAAYRGATKTTSSGASYEAGLASISIKFGHCLLDVATGRDGEPSCITLMDIDIELGEEVVEQIRGPGNLTKRLGINKENRDSYDGKSIYGQTMWIEGDPVNKSEIRRLKGNSPNCVGIYKF